LVFKFEFLVLGYLFCTNNRFQEILENMLGGGSKHYVEGEYERGRRKGGKLKNKDER
jgi:hypothetical protein